MNGKSIRLVSTGSGLGVNLDNATIKATGNVNIDASGDARLGKISASHLYAATNLGTLTSAGQIVTTGNTTLVAPTVNLHSVLSSEGNIDVFSGSGNITINENGNAISKVRTTLFSGKDLIINGYLKSSTGNILLYANQDLSLGSKALVDTTMKLTATAGQNFKTLRWPAAFFRAGLSTWTRSGLIMPGICMASMA